MIMIVLVLIYFFDFDNKVINEISDCFGIVIVLVVKECGFIRW